MTLHPRVTVGAIACALLFGAAAPARADLTWFAGGLRRPAALVVPAATAGSSRLQGMMGVAGGISLLVIGFEGEGSAISENQAKQTPGMKIGMVSGLVQTPTGATQLYAAVGGGLYRESLTGSASRTDLVTNIGGGLKLALAGPLRLRIDYRVLHLRGKPSGTTGSNVQRFYAGLNVRF